MKVYNSKKSLKRAILIIQILCICTVSICGCSSKADETATETTQAETMPQLDTTQMPLLYSFETGFGHLVEIYQAKALHGYNYGHNHIYSLAFSVDGEFQFVYDICYDTQPMNGFVTYVYQGDLPKEAIDSYSSEPSNDPNVEDRDWFTIKIDRYYKNYYNKKYYESVYDYDSKQKEKYCFIYNFSDDGHVLEFPSYSRLRIREKDIKIINEELTVNIVTKDY